MRVLVAGGMGAIGRPLIPMLVGAGHEVFASTRAESKADQIKATGATPVVADFLETGAAEAAIEASRPDAVIDLLTSLPQDFDPRRAKSAYEANDRVRREGTGALLAAAAAGGVNRYLCQSVAFLYRPGGDAPRSEDDPIWSDAPAPYDKSVAVLAENERKVTQNSAFTGVVLRYGFLYGPGTWFETGGSTYNSVQKRQYPLIGDGGGINSMVHVADAASATLAALERGEGIYNIVDDDPAAMSDLVPAYAEMIGAGPPRKIPSWIARIAVGKYLIAAATTLPGASNQKAKRELGWAPAIPSWRTGLRDFRDSDPALTGR